jgi:hypothetical protein
MEANVTTGKGQHFQSADVEISSYTEMTPDAAIACRNVAFGVAATAIVRGGGKVYRVTGIGKNAKAVELSG